MGGGNGVLDAGEGCDDGNLTNGDGCDATCTPEPGFTCVMNRDSLCTRSCAGLPQTCGYNGNADCCTSPQIPGGSFYRDYDGQTYTSQAYPASVSDFRFDTYDITVGRFRKFVAAYSQTMIPAGAGKNTHNPSDPGWNVAWNASLPADATALKSSVSSDSSTGGGYSTWSDTPHDAVSDTRPINSVSWYVAQAFCIWDGGRLPTEAEWLYAAAAGSDQRVYPWGTSNPNISATTYANYGCYFANYATGTGVCSGYTNIAPVGWSPSGVAWKGLMDVSGNLSQWVQDTSVSPYAISPCNDCADLSGDYFRSLRGGSFDRGPSYLLVGNRLVAASTDRRRFIGVRCARSYH